MKVVGWCVLGAFLGCLVSTLFWCAYFLIEGASITKAIRGEVEDAWDKLQALLMIGGMVGGGVGLLYGLTRGPDKGPSVSDAR
jgi:hypothetical protein